ncbi:DUF3606 domain-containing protein [Duganella sp. P38]|uniref:DUF3606 domain-containing protein n=1 Tax=Duganella sp. P38 TaxID=3423949 RepID=UPI003D7AE011
MRYWTQELGVIREQLEQAVRSPAAGDPAQRAQAARDQRRVMEITWSRRLTSKHNRHNLRSPSVGLKTAKQCNNKA